MKRFTQVDLLKVSHYARSASKKGGKKPLFKQVALKAAWDAMPSGNRKYLGIPFRTPGKDIAALGSTIRHLKLPVGAKAAYLCFLHFCDAPTPGKAPDLGTLIATYTLAYKDGSSYVTPIRKGFEVNSFTQRGRWDSFASLPYIGTTVVEPGEAMPWGRYQTGTKREFESPFIADVFALANPHPEKAIAEIALDWASALSVGILGLTLFNGPGHPLRLERRSVFKVALPPGEKAASGEVDAEIDMGTITSVDPDPGKIASDWTSKPVAGLGKEPDRNAKSAFLVELAAARGAALKIKSGEHPAHEFEMQQVYEKGRARSTDGKARIEMLHRNRRWVTVRVVDGSTDQPTPARVHFSGPDGEYLPPHGHHAKVNTNWFEDYAGELKLGATSYAYVPGEFQIELPVGDVYVEVSKGFEYAPVRQKIQVVGGMRHLTIGIPRPMNLSKEGWTTADTHVHFISPQTAWLEGQAEGLNLVNLLASQWGRLFTNVADISGEASGSSKNGTMVWVGTENRHHMLGHLSMLGTKGLPVFPMCSGGPAEAYIGDPEYSLLAEWAERVRSQGGAAIRPHFPGPVAEDPAYIINGLADAVEIRNSGRPGKPPEYSGSLAEWYRYLNCGYKVTAAGGTDKMSATTPVGGSRTYAKVSQDEPFSFSSWARAVREGRTFVSNGPVLSFSVEGKEIGSEILLPRGGGNLQIEAKAGSVWPIHQLDLIVNGKVVDSTRSQKGDLALRLARSLRIDRSCWIAARCTSGLEKHQSMMGSGFLGAHTSPVYVRVADSSLFSPTDALYMMTLLEGTIAYLDTIGTRLSDQRNTEMIHKVRGAHEELAQRYHAHAHEHEGEAVDSGHAHGHHHQP